VDLAPLPPLHGSDLAYVVVVAVGGVVTAAALVALVRAWRRGPPAREAAAAG
jgi:hypothetical protein